LSVVELTDLFLYDVKIVDDARHRIYTGVSNAGILENLRVLSRCHRNIWIRIPIVAGFNDLPGDLEQTADLLASLPGLRRISLLPYHELGMHKSQRLGKVEPFADLAPPSADALIMAASRFQHLGVPVQIGA
jgi:pyruvate formate lyase activating enzyme